MEPAMMALVGLLLQVTLATESAYKKSAKNLNSGDVDLIISSALRQLSAAVYNNLSKDHKSSLEQVQFKLASLFNDLQEQCQTLSIDTNDLAALNTEARMILGTVLESIYGPKSNKGVPASMYHGTLVKRPQPDSLAKLPDADPGHGAESRKIRGHTRDSCTTNRLPCIVCQVKNIQCSYKNDLSSCEACRKSKVRCIKQLPLGPYCQISPPSLNTLVEAPGKSGESGIMKHGSVVDLTQDTRVTRPTIPVPNPYPGPVLKCPECEKTDNRAWCPGPDDYRGHQYLICKLGRPTSNAPPPAKTKETCQFSPTSNGKPDTLNGDGAIFGPLVNASSGHHPPGKKRGASASEAIQEDQEVIKRAKNNETSREHQARMAREYEELRNETLEVELALLRRVAGGA